jgi:hypothetical protein
MSKLTEQLKTIGVYNAWGFAAKGVPYIEYFPADNGRLTSHYAYWAVVRPGFKVDPDNFLHNYHQEFTVTCRENKAKALAEAQAWAGQRYSISEWAKTPYGSYMDAGYVKQRIADLKQELDVSAKNKGSK